MVRENRIKDVHLSHTFTAATSGVAIYSDDVINGEILQIEQSAFWQNGSLSMTPSGLPGQEIWRKNASSGASTSISYPAHFTESATGSIANARHVPYVLNDMLVITTGSTASGTSHTLDIKVKYR